MIWIHAVSAGETIAAAPLIARLKAAGFTCLVTNMTPAGRERVAALLAAQPQSGPQIENCYAPYDLPGAVDRFVRNNRPRLLLTIDTELWPNTLHICRVSGVKTMLVNGRLSARSASGYARIGALSSEMVGNLDHLAVQTEQHKARFLSLGASPDRVEVTGSLKFDATVAPDHQAQVSLAEQQVLGRPVLLGASTHEGEEAALLRLLPTLKQILPEVLLIIAPRHTHRADRVAQLCESVGFNVQRRNETGEPVTADVLLIDTMGVLAAYYAVARVAFVGGSLVPVGGHNLLEGVRAGSAVVMGSHLDNIDDIAHQFVDVDGMCVANDETVLQRLVVELMIDDARRQAMVSAADQVLHRNQGALDRVFRCIHKALEED